MSDKPVVQFVKETDAAWADGTSTDAQITAALATVWNALAGA